MLHSIGKPKVTVENYTIEEDEWLFHQNCAERIHTYLFGVSEATKLEFSQYYQLSATKDREWLPIRKRPGNMIDKRNGRPCINLGDKFYKTVEFSPDFFKKGAPVSPPVFGIGGKKEDTFIPISKEVVHKTLFASNRRQQRLADEIQAVIELENWRPAPPLKIYKGITTS